MQDELKETLDPNKKCNLKIQLTTSVTVEKLNHSFVKWRKLQGNLSHGVSPIHCSAHYVKRNSHTHPTPIVKQLI